jgi:hypothetical protein
MSAYMDKRLGAQTRKVAAEIQKDTARAKREQKAADAKRARKGK